MSQLQWNLSEYDDPGALPLFIDLQVTGFAGIDFLTAQSAEDIHKVAKAILASGTGALQPTLTPAPLDQMLRAITLIESARRENRENQAEIIGIHLEGPFLHPEFSGIHPIKDLKKPDLKVLTSYLTAGVITSMTISPEVEGALDLIKFLTGMGVGVWIGYSSADIERSREALDAGAIGFTDLSDPCSKKLQQYALEQSDGYLKVILDSEGSVDLITRAQDRVIAVSGLGVEGSLRSGFEKLLAAGLSLESCVMACTRNAARSMDRMELGEVEFGRLAQRFTQL